jgi:hypothetical protein
VCGRGDLLFEVPLDFRLPTNSTVGLKGICAPLEATDARLLGLVDLLLLLGLVPLGFVIGIRSWRGAVTRLNGVSALRVLL